MRGDLRRVGWMSAGCGVLAVLFTVCLHREMESSDAGLPLPVFNDTQAAGRILVLHRGIEGENYDVIWQKSLFSPDRQFQVSAEKSVENSGLPVAADPGVPRVRGILRVDSNMYALLEFGSLGVKLLKESDRSGDWTVVSISESEISLRHNDGELVCIPVTRGPKDAGKARFV